MKVQSSAAAGSRNLSGSQDKSQKTERFSKVLAEKRKESSVKIDPAVPAMQPAMGEQQGTADQNFTSRPETISSSSMPPNIVELASEIVDHMVLSGTQNAPVVDIEFKSRTLDGLQVKVQSFEGLVSVNFSTIVPRVAELLNANLDSLRFALESRGVRIKQLGISSSGSSTTGRNGRWNR